MIVYKFRLYPKRAEAEKLETAKEVCRQTYNNLLAELNNGFTKNELQNFLLDLKVVNPEMNGVHSKVLQMENQRLFGNLSSLLALKKKGHKVGRLRFKGKNWFKTFTYNQSGFELTHIRGKKGILWLSKIGDIPIKIHRQVEGKIKNITVKKSNGRWHCSIVTDANPKRACGTKEIGIDVGVMNYIYDSDGKVYENPKHFDKYHSQLKIAQQSLSKKKKGSNSRKKARGKVAKIHEKIANARDDFIHKLSAKLIRESRFIAVEKLNIKNLMSISYNAKNIADASWGKLISYLHYKAENAGCVVQDVDPFCTTRDCSFCGHRNNKLELSQRKFICEKCKRKLPRDYNSALNIFVRGKELASMENASNTGQIVQQEASMKSEAITSNRC
ncbi:IS200/IS605 family element transposase accessory protein TnpB [Candidatus Woesearchaeota archaeon]|nr:IS200/IS605 family element transposase accessory protein TnpB [Candidatus Woesearchaeota archaeon]